MKQLYAIGVDYGTESGRALLVDLSTGQEVATHVTPYRHGVIEDTLPDSDIRLGYDWALQHPEDYIEVLQSSIPHVLAQAGIEADQVIGIGVDFTACTMMPLDAGGTPLCLMEKWKHHPHAWVKLWKHHAAQEEANRINEAALARDEKFLARHGGKVSSEWMLAKSWQILNEAPEIYEEAVLFMEAADWIVMQMTGQLVRSSCTAGYKANWHKREGFLPRHFSDLLIQGWKIWPIRSSEGGFNHSVQEPEG